ncbi:MAG: conserved phage C-terminal domain-containing protein [Oscillospiraceae bacterium]|nr:conserved phage C-terminal domain-containing protein [Oscillospiraceae bacterium]
MSVMRIHKNRDYTVVSNVHLRDKRISLKAKGLLTLMLSLPDDWDYSIAGLAAICKENRTAIQTTLRELEEVHYLRRTKERNSKGQFECIYEIFEVPQDDSSQLKNGGSDGSENNVRSCPAVPEKPKHKSRDTGPVTENQPPDTLYKQNTDYQVQKPKKETKNTEKKKICLAVIAHLNEAAGTGYKAENKKTQSLIKARLKEGYQLEDFIRVIDKKKREWTGTDFVQYLRPTTLFGEKFESYLNAPEIPNKSAPKPNTPPKPDILDGIF